MASVFKRVSGESKLLSSRNCNKEENTHINLVQQGGVILVLKLNLTGLLEQSEMLKELCQVSS